MLYYPYKKYNAAAGRSLRRRGIAALFGFNFPPRARPNCTAHKQPDKSGLPSAGRLCSPQSPASGWKSRMSTDERSGFMDITFLYHSGFLVETRRHILLFDYYLDTPKGGRAF